MPFTPLHLGPGMALKTLAGRRLSLLAFALAQVAMDLEPLFGLALGAARLHGPTHTYLAALVIAAAVAALVPWLRPPLARRWNRELDHYRLAWPRASATAALGATLVGAFAGTLSHVALDSVMHADMTPFAPWSGANGLYGSLSPDALQGGCVLSGIAGAFAWPLARRWRLDVASRVILFRDGVKRSSRPGRSC